MQAWNVKRAALYGAAIGLAAAAFKLFSPWSEPHTAVALIEEFAGAPLGFALLCALAAVLRNFVVRRVIAPHLR
jgi:hypothetical protein